MKLDSNGGIEWQKAYGGTGPDHPYAVQQTADGGYIAISYTTSFGKVDMMSGSSSWTKMEISSGRTHTGEQNMNMAGSFNRPVTVGTLWLVNLIIRCRRL